MPTVAAVIPAYNAGDHIGRALASVRLQSAPVAEVIVVDDGSSDDTAARAAAAAPGAKVLRQPNAGPSAARNRGVGEARSDLIAFLDADDEWLPDAVASLAKVLEELPQAALVTADMAAVDEHGLVHDRSWFARHGCAEEIARWQDQPVRNAVAALVRRNFVATSVVMVRASVFRDLGGFREDLRYGEDLELWARIAARHPIVCLSQVLGLRRSHAANTTKATEPLLLGLVRTSEVLRDWAGTILREQGVDPDEMVANARTDLGYFYFASGRTAEARAALRAAVRDALTPRALRYLGLACLPSAAITNMRRIKQALHG